MTLSDKKVLKSALLGVKGKHNIADCKGARTGTKTVHSWNIRTYDHGNRHDKGTQLFKTNYVVEESDICNTNNSGKTGKGRVTIKRQPNGIIGFETDPIGRKKIAVNIIRMDHSKSVMIPGVRGMGKHALPFW